MRKSRAPITKHKFSQTKPKLMALLLFTFANEKIIFKIVSVELRAQNIY